MNIRSDRPIVDVVAGARPNFMKIAPILRAIQALQRQGSRLCYRLVHTGQHYDASMSGDFFTQLGIPEPDVNLEVGSGTQAEQTAAIMTRYEKLLLGRAQRPVPGGRRRHLDHGLRHRRAEARHAGGARRSAASARATGAMPEEINRLVTDSITN